LTHVLVPAQFQSGPLRQQVKSVLSGDINSPLLVPEADPMLEEEWHDVVLL